MGLIASLLVFDPYEERTVTVYVKHEGRSAHHVPGYTQDNDYTLPYTLPEGSTVSDLETMMSQYASHKLHYYIKCSPPDTIGSHLVANRTYVMYVENKGV